MTPARWQRIEDIYQGAQERSPDELDQWLSATCAGDEELRREVERLLAADAQASGFLDKPALQMEARALAVAQLTEAGAEALVGRQFSHYQVLSRLGAGGMGEVYLARDLALERQVAIKVLPALFTQDADRLQRFVREAKAASALNHPNIITIHEIGKTPLAGGDLQYIVTEFIEGETLRQRLRGAGVQPAEALDLAAQMAAALQAAHAVGIVHRDIKPENVMVRPDGLVKVLDFGLAKLAERRAQPVEADSAAPTLMHASTQPGMVMGTLTYMSPEQVRGEPVDARSDLFSLGIVLYEMLVGRSPFARKTPADIIAAILEHTPPPLTDALPDAPPALAELVSRLLCKDREQRGPQAGALAVELKRLKQLYETGTVNSHDVTRELAATREHQPVAPATQLQAVQVTGTFKRPRLNWALAAMLLLSVAAGLSYFMYSRLTAEIDSIAIMPLVNVDDDAGLEYLSDGLTESLINNLARVPRLKVTSRTSVFRYKGKKEKDLDVEEIRARFKVRAVLTGSVKRRGDIYDFNFELTDARDQVRLWGKTYTRQFANMPAVTAEVGKEVSLRLRAGLNEAEQQRVAGRTTGDAEAYRLYLLGRHEWNKFGEEDIRRGIDYLRQAIALDQKFALAHASLSQAYSGLTGNYQSPTEVIPLAKEHATRAIQLDEGLDEAHYALGRVLWLYEWDWAGAQREFQRALDINPNYALAHTAQGVLARIQGRVKEDLAACQLALELDPLSLQLQLSLGLGYYAARQYTQAIRQMETTAKFDPSSFFPHLNMAQCWMELKKYDEALKQLEQARALASNNPRVLAAFGYYYATVGKPAEARQVLEELARPGAPYVPPTFIAMIYTALGQNDQAFDWLNRAFAERSQWILLLNVEPKFDRLRADPRFAKLVEKLNLTRIALRGDQPRHTLPDTRRIAYTFPQAVPTGL
jgi:serine/threonine protein kinase/Tfp pilus assembly protein PilF